MTQKSYDELLNKLIQKNFQKRLEKLADKYHNKRIIIYGAGLLFSIIKDNFDLSKLNIIGISDKKFCKIEGAEEAEITDKNAELKQIDPYDIYEYSPDVILIAIYYPYKVIEFLKDRIQPDIENVKIKPILKKSFIEEVKDLIDFYNL